ncbi:MAG TPA: hypothetical protein DDY35_09550, partial [Acidimicrobiaceae bacterium]|nr:hypothetical protein [Acidimicrobiaceae bacterium]
DALVGVVHNAVVTNGIGPHGGVRTRAIVRNHYRVGDADPANAMIAVVARLGPGRDAQTKKVFIDEILDAAEAHTMGESDALDIAWSLEVQEIDAEFRVNRNHVATAMRDRGEH